MSSGNEIKTDLDLRKSLLLIRNLADECLDGLGETSKSVSDKGRRRRSSKNSILDPDFEMPMRAFFKKYGQGLSLPKRFALVVAFLTEGDIEKEATYENIKKTWQKVSAHLESFNSAYSTRSCDADFVEARKHGSYGLRPKWRDALQL